MEKRDLIKYPYWEGKDLGNAIPDSPHAVSVALPRWEDVIDYEEKKPSCLNTLKSIYPRFGLNPLVAKVAQIALDKSKEKGIAAWPFPNIETAKEAEKHCLKSSAKGNAWIIEVANLQCLITNEKSNKPAKEFWQHTGLGASSRQAAIALKIENSPEIKKLPLQNQFFLID